MFRVAGTVVLLAAMLMLMGGLDTAAAVQKADPRWIPADPIVDPDAAGPGGLTAVPYQGPGEYAGSPLGQTYLLGTTWYDYQSNGSLGKMVALSSSRGVHFCWMNGVQAQAIDRHVFYNYYNPITEDLSWSGDGYQVDQGERAGYTNLSLFSGGEAVVGYHSRPAASSGWNTQVAWDFLEGFGAFQLTDLDNLPGWGRLMWPHVAVCSQDYIHVVSSESRDDAWQRIAYARSENGGISFAPFASVDMVLIISADVAVSPVSNKVGIAYCKPIFDPQDLGPYAGLSVSQRNNDVVLIESEDGSTWYFTAQQNITSCIAPDTSRYPDSTYADGDTLRAYCDVSLLYDQNDNAHVAFTSKGLWFDARLASHPDSFAVVGMTQDASVIWHWSEEHDSLTVVAKGWYDVGDPDVGANEYRGAGTWRSTVDRPSLGLDPATGYLYCLYTCCMPGDTSGGPIPSHGYANGELFCSVSTDGGLMWSEGTNLTSTPSPDAYPGQCMDEDYASLAAEVNDTLHIIYVEDKDAGGVVMTAPQEGTWTENPVRYQRVPAGLVAPGPPYVGNYWFHVGAVPPPPPSTDCYCLGGTDGSSHWDLLDHQGTPLETGDYVYVAWAGPDGQIDPPALSKGPGEVSGDDSLLVEGCIEDLGYRGYLLTVDIWDPGIGFPNAGDLVYCRIFDGPEAELSPGHYYGDSQLYICQGIEGEEFYCLFPGDPGGGYTDLPLAQPPTICYCIGGVDEDGFYWDLLDYQGNPLEEGDYVYAAWAGPDGQIDPPAASKGIGGITGDDSLLVEGFIEDWGFRGFGLTLDVWDSESRHPAIGDLIYCRIFDAPQGDLSLGHYYGDSQLYQCQRIDGEEFYCLFTGDPGNGHTDTPLAPLAVTLLSFEARGRDAQVILEWRTATESDCFGFHIERSADGKTFHRITTAPVTSAGSSERGSDYTFLDRDVVNRVEYHYNLIEIDLDGRERMINEVPASATPQSRFPASYALHQNHPNPFNAATEIRYQLPVAGHVTLKIYNTLGQEVRTLVDGAHEAGVYSARWDGCDRDGREAASGLYFCRMVSGDDSRTIKMVLLR